MPTKRKLWIVYQYDPKGNSNPAIGDPEFVYLSHNPQKRHLYEWTCCLSMAHKFEKKVAEKEAYKRGARIDYHPEFRYA